MEIPIIAFDGLHKSGKGRHIEILRNKLFEKNYFSMVARGDGTRKGIGNEVFDYKASWWRDNAEFFMKRGSIDEEIFKMQLKYQRLNREINYFRKKIIPKKVVKGNYFGGFLILDRSFVSHYFTMTQFLPGITLEKSLECYNPKNNKRVYVEMPDLTFVLNASKEILLKRIDEADENPDKTLFKRKVVSDNYELFLEKMRELKDKSLINLISTEKPQESVSKRIYEIVEAKFF